MRDSQEIMIRFAKIVERHPEIYNHNLDAYKTRQVDIAWDEVASSVRVELKEECTVEELKIRWKGIRSSFNRYKNKILNPNDANASNCKKYYLYDTLKFLEPFTKPRGTLLKESVFVYDEESKASNENNSSDEWNAPETKPDISNEQVRPEVFLRQKISNINTSEYTNCEKAKKRKYSSEDKGVDDDNEDLQFFKSILPDIRDFTNKEKRKLKMGILRLIDDLENERKQQ